MITNERSCTVCILRQYSCRDSMMILICISIACGWLLQQTRTRTPPSRRRVCEASALDIWSSDIWSRVAGRIPDIMPPDKMPHRKMTSRQNATREVNGRTKCHWRGQLLAHALSQTNLLRLGSYFIFSWVFLYYCSVRKNHLYWIETTAVKALLWLACC